MSEAVIAMSTSTQSRALPQAALSIYGKYSAFVHKHSTIVKLLESSIMNAAYYAPSRFDGSAEVLSEV
jgi:hypothetical protein